MAASGADDADEQLWAAVRGFSDAELHDTQASIRQFHCADASAFFSRSEAPDSSGQNAAISLQLGDKPHRVRVDDFLHVFLDFVHRRVQLHTEARVSGDAPTSAAQEPRSINMATVATFEDEFPQLTVHTSSKPTKRRITTTLLTPKDSAVVARPMPAAIAFPPLGASESTRPPAWAKRSLLEKRMGAASAPSAWQTEPSPTIWGAIKKPEVVTTPAVMTNKRNAAMIASKKNKIVEPSGPQQLQVKKKPESNQVIHLHKASLTQKQKDVAASTIKKSDISSTDFHVNKQAAKLYGFLIRERFVKNTCAELQVVVNLLYQVDCNKARASCKTPLTSDHTLSEFCWRSHCLHFAQLVFHEIEPVLEHLGAELLGLVKHSLRDAEGICQEMLERLDHESRRREELRVAESARIGCQLPVEMKASTVRDFALPFNEETDSRLHYRTPAESLLYTNREKVRDGFLSLLRQFQQKQHSLVGIENAGVAAAAITAARGLLAEVSPENRWWFATFFVQELVQVGSNPFGESDKDLVLKIMEDKLVVKNPDRLRKLHRRFSSQKPLNKTSSSNSNRANGKGGPTNSLKKNRQEIRTNSNEDDATQKFSATFDRMKSYFTDNQLFFFHFLHSCDSYEFSELVKHQLVRQFDTIYETKSPSVDPRKEFTEVVLQLKVVAKFLGYLRFSPQWQVTSSIRGLSAKNAAFKAVEREGIKTLEMARESSLDVKKLLEKSILHASISKCIPWLCDYLSMLSLDRLSSGTTYFKQLVVLLQLLYRSARLKSLGETGLYIAMQIEHIFDVLRLDGGFLHGSDYQSTELFPAREIREALAHEDEALPEESSAATGDDHLPFLYSQVFVQSCVSDLDDLRGFIQTRAQPTRRRNLSLGSSSLMTGQSVTPIRKLRPLQVVLEGDHGPDGISSFTIRHDNVIAASGKKLSKTGFPTHFPSAQEENDRLSEAVFKVHPRLKAVVEFVVGTVTTDVCEHVMTHIVTSRADVLVDWCASESGLLTVGQSATLSCSDDAFAARASFQVLITSKTRHEANAAVMVALDEAFRLGQERVNAALPPFMAPSLHPTLANSIVFMALQRTRGALKALVPKSAQTEFVKRVAFRNKSLLKDLGSASKVAAVARPSILSTSEDSATASHSSTNNQNVVSNIETDQNYRELRRFSAEISKSASQVGHRNPNLSQWEAQATTVLQSLSQFINSLNEWVATEDWTDTTKKSPLRVSTLVLWDIIWRAITSCLKFWSSSLDLFAACELLSMKESRVKAVEKVFIEVVSRFTALLQVVVHSVGNVLDDDIAVQSLLVFVVDYVMQLPSTRLAAVSESDLLIKRFAVRASSLVVAKLRAMVSTPEPEDADKIGIDLNWDQWIDSSSLSLEAQFRRDVWEASAATTTKL